MSTDPRCRARDACEKRAKEAPVQHVYPSPEGETTEHKLDGLCWCQPLVETDPLGGRLYIHRRSLDSPHIEEPTG